MPYRKNINWSNSVKPSQGAIVDVHHPIGHDIIAYFLPRAGGPLRDLSRTNFALNINGTPVFTPRGLRCDTTDAGAQITLLPRHRINPPLTVCAKVHMVGTPDNYSTFFGQAHNNADLSPYQSGSICVDQNPFYRFGYNDGGGNYLAAESTVTAAAGQSNVFTGVLTSAGGTLYQNQTVIATQTGTATLGYDASALMGMGDITGFNRNPNAIIEWGFVARRALTLKEIREILSNNYCFITRPPSRRIISQVAGAGGWGKLLAGRRNRLVMVQ